MMCATAIMIVKGQYYRYLSLQSYCSLKSILEFIFVCQILPWKSQSLRDTMTGFAKLKH